MNILVTGSNGQLGQELKTLKNSYPHWNFLFTDVKELDILDPKAIELWMVEKNITAIINCAAYTAVDKAETEKEKAYAVNEQGVKNLAEVCKALDIPLLHISTDYVFDGDKKTPYLETDTPNPTGVYGASKLAGEIALQELWHKHIILRVSWVFGAHGHNFVKTMLRLSETRDELGVVNDQFGAPTGAKSIADCLLDIIEKNQFNKSGFPWGLYHYQSEPGVSWYDFAGDIFAQAKNVGLLNKDMLINPISSDQFPTPVKRPENSKLDGNKINQALNLPAGDWKNQLLDMLKAI